jgi:hypothetical protein
MSDVNDFLFGGGGKAAKFDQIGDFCEGTITDVRMTQQTSMDDNQPLTWSDGSPRMQLVITLQTKLTEGENDDGLRRLYAKGGNFEVAEGSGKSMKDAIADAVKRAEAKSIDEGGTLKVAYTGVGKKTNRGYQAPKLFKAAYKVPVSSVPTSELFDDE